MITQNIIHKLEESPAMRRWLKLLACVLVGLVLLLLCNWRYFRNFSTQEAMDSAQLARNISEGQGYTTLFVRPFSMYLQQQVNEAKRLPVAEGTKPDYSKINTTHPDVSNPPVYPVVLAGWMKVHHGFAKVLGWVRNVSPGFVKRFIPQLEDSPTNTFWMKDGRFFWNPGDYYIGVFNQLVFFSIILLIFFWARRLFDARVAWLSATLLFCSEFLWQFSMSGLSTMFLLLIFVGLVWCLTLFDREMREPQWQPRAIHLLALAMGLLVGLGALTRYGFIFMIIPVIAFLLIFGGSRRVSVVLIAFFVFAAVTTPWLVRNLKLTGMPFGTQSYAMLEQSGPPVFAEDHLNRSLHPNIRIYLPAVGLKMLNNVRGIMQNDLPTLGGSWVTPLFLAGLLISFRNPGIRRIRYFLLMSLFVLVLVQALGRTQLSDALPTFNSENVLVLLFPLVVVYGVSLFFVFLDQMSLPLRPLRYVVIGLFGFITCLPFVIGMSACLSLILPFIPLLPSRPAPETYPYKPAVIQSLAKWMKPEELVMSDMPWAVAWYGHRQSVMLTLKAGSTIVEDGGSNEETFFELNDFRKTVNALYLTPFTTDKQFVTGWIKTGERSWGAFVIDTIMRQQVPATFPLRKTLDGFLPEQMFISDWERWR